MQNRDYEFFRRLSFHLAGIALLGVPLLLFGQSSDIPWSTDKPSPAIEKLRGEIAAGNTSALARFWDGLKQQHTPMIEPISGDNRHSLVTFIYRGTPDTKGVVLYCMMIVGRDFGANLMTRLDNTDLWFKTYVVRNDMRLGYSFIPNPTRESVNSPQVGMRDPLNPRDAPEAAFMGHSVLELPDAPPQPWITPTQGVAAGKLEELIVQSKVLKGERGALVYTPAGFDRLTPKAYPLLVCFDGDAYASTNYMPLTTILDNLIAARKIPAIVAVLVRQSPQPNRNIELSNNQAFLDFVADELLPRVREKWHATNDPGATVVTGSSAGGLASAFFAFRRPGVFGNVLSQSGAFWPGEHRDDPDHEWLTRQYESSPRLPIRFVLQVGLLERGATPGNGPSILETNRHLHEVLIRKGYDVQYAEIAGGHEPLNWRGGIADGLVHLFGAGPEKQNGR